VDAQRYVMFGLGNPGWRYRNTRHNIGFQICRRFARSQGWPLRKRGGNCRFGVGRQGEREIVVALPQTFMNRSGEAVRAMLGLFPVPSERCLVVVDDFQLPLGSIRLRRGGSSGGHKGLESICGQIGNDFCRLRVGIGPKPREGDVVQFVLGRWPWAERRKVKAMIERAVKAAETFLAEGMEAAMSRHNAGAPKEEKEL
jgi:PTH1 family peptidyl-tRNA hydrolase